MSHPHRLSRLIASTGCMLVSCTITGPLLAALPAPVEAQFREAHALEKAYTGAANDKRRAAILVATQLGRENNRDAAAFLLELGDWALLMAFADYWKGPLTPELEVLVVKQLYDPQWRACAAALLVRDYQLRELYQALLEKSRAMPDGYPTCVRALVKTRLPGIEPDLIALLPRVDDYYARQNVATFLVERKATAAEPALIQWLDGSSDKLAGSVVWVIAKLDTPGLLDAFTRRLARLKDAPQDADTGSTVASLVGAIQYVTPQLKLDRRLLGPAVLERFSAANREKIEAMMRRREELEAMSEQPNPENLSFWIGRDRNDIVRAFVAAGMDGNARNRDGDTALHSAVKSRNWEAMDVLLAAGADPNGRDWRGETVLTTLATHKPVAQDYEAPAVAAAKLLVAKGANPSLPSTDTTTPLHRATGNDYASMVHGLVEAGADVNAESSELGIAGLRPLQVAEDHGFTGLVAYLKSKGGKTNLLFSTKRAAQRALINTLAPFLHMH